MTPRDDVDALVIGAGFGGLAAALRLCERGAKVAVVERLTYPGGCAATFTRGGVRYEAGATLFSGFAPGQHFARVLEAHGLDVDVELLDPTLHFVSPRGELRVPPDRGRFVEEMVARARDPGATRRFLDEQGRVAALLWALFDDERLLPPLSIAALFAHFARSPRYLPLLRWLGRPLIDVMRHHHVDDEPLLRGFVDALCQITVQCGAAEAEANFALAAMDYPFRGTGHVVGGVGRLADALVDAIRRRGGEVCFAERARAVTREEGRFSVVTRGRRFRAKTVFANVVPSVAAQLLGAEPPVEDHRWSAAMLYGRLRLPDERRPFTGAHLQLVDDDRAPLQHGNHVFLSIAGERDARGTAPGEVTFTASTHVDLATQRDAPDPGAFIDEVHARMRATLARRAAPWWSRVVDEMTASPRTFARFTGRPDGWVGGPPRRAGWHHYVRLGPVELRPGFFLVGDSVFLGQSTLAVSIAGARTADAAARRLRA